MLDVGLTGGIAAGKSAVAARLVELGAVLIDADALARRVVEPGTTGLAAIVEAFGAGLLDAAGRLDRPRLGRIVFADAAARERLNGIVHPLVRAEAARIRGQAAAAETVHAPVVLVQDIPLLVESGQAGSFDVVVTVQAPEQERIRRMVQDRGMDAADAAARIAAQASDAERAAISDVVLQNSGTTAELLAAVDELWRIRLLPAATAAAGAGDPSSRTTSGRQP
ncbi:MAG TPA: dephospho-CoA kinase [Arthrobacter sp.]|nr:dephospho-CoA kinase [Arthrobacter sp.]